MKLKETVFQIKESKRRLVAINAVLGKVEARIGRVRDRLVGGAGTPAGTPAGASQPEAGAGLPRRTLG